MAASLATVTCSGPRCRPDRTAGSTTVSAPRPARPHNGIRNRPNSTAPRSSERYEETAQGITRWPRSFGRFLTPLCDWQLLDLHRRRQQCRFGIARSRRAFAAGPLDATPPDAHALSGRRPMRESRTVGGRGASGLEPRQLVRGPREVGPPGVDGSDDDARRGARHVPSAHGVAGKLRRRLDVRFAAGSDGASH
jgi:hypothetical protein